MAKPIFWSPLSVNDFSKILDYLNFHWDENVVRHFIDVTESNLEQISINPRQYPIIYRKKKIRKCVLTKHNSLFYMESKTQIDILRIYDTRQDPDNLIFK